MGIQDSEATGSSMPAAIRFPRRAERARRTRAAVLRAAAELFGEQGYRATTIEQIAERADVGRPTVFTAVPGGKPALLKAARDLALAGDDELIPVPQRPWFLEAISQDDPRELVRRQARNYRHIHQRAARLELTLGTAAAVDPALHDLHREAVRQRRLGSQMVADRLHELNALPATMGATRAGDIIFGLACPEVYHHLADICRWTGDEYEQWLSRTLQQALLAPTSPEAERLQKKQL